MTAAPARSCRRDCQRHRRSGPLRGKPIHRGRCCGSYAAPAPSPASARLGRQFEHHPFADGVGVPQSWRRRRGWPRAMPRVEDQPELGGFHACGVAGDVQHLLAQPPPALGVNSNTVRSAAAPPSRSCRRDCRPHRRAGRHGTIPSVPWPKVCSISPSSLRPAVGVNSNTVPHPKCVTDAAGKISAASWSCRRDCRRHRGQVRRRDRLRRVRAEVMQLPLRPATAPLGVISNTVPQRLPSGQS